MQWLLGHGLPCFWPALERDAWGCTIETVVGAQDTHIIYEVMRLTCSHWPKTRYSDQADSNVLEVRGDMMAEKSFFRTAMSIAVPVGLQSMLQSSFSMVDQLMVGQLGTTAVSSVEVASRPAFLCSVVLGAMATVAGIMISQYIGMHAGEMTDRSVSVNVVFAGTFAAIFMGMCLAVPEQIARFFVANDEEVVAHGAQYMRWIAWTYLPMAISSILAAYVRCRDRAALPLIAGICSAVVNTVLNYVFIFGNFGFAPMGVVGAAIASVISQLVNLGIMFFVYWKVRSNDGRRFSFSLRLGVVVWRQYAAMLLPVLISEFLWSLGQTANTYIYGHMLPGDLAAYSMTGPIQGLVIGALFGISQAAGILVGKRLGASDAEGAFADSRKLLAYGIVGALVLAVAIAVLRVPYVGLYNVEPSVRASCNGILLAFAMLTPVKVTNMILGGGVVRSGGKTFYIMAIDVAGAWAVGVPLGLFAAFVLHLTVPWVYFISSLEEVVRLFLTIRLFRSGKWMQTLSKDAV